MSIPICETINTGTSNYYYQGKPSEKILNLVSNEKQKYKNNLQIFSFITHKSGYSA